MADFDSVGAGFSRGLARGSAIKFSRAENKRREVESAALLQKQQSDKFKADIELSRTETIESIKQLREAGVQVLQGGGDRTDPRFQEVEKGIQALAMGHGSSLQEIRESMAALGMPADAIELIEDPNAFVENQVLTATTAFDAAVEQRTPDFLPPERVAEVGFPEGSVVSVDKDGQPTLKFDPTSDTNSLQIRFDFLKQSGIDDARAAGIVGGRFVITTNPITNTSIITDLAGEQIGEPLPASTDPVIPIVPPGTDPTEALGISGFFKNATNVITDAFGGGQFFPDTQEATDALNTIQQTTKLLLQAAVEGRPAVDVREGLEKLTVPPNSPLKGREGALSRFEQTKRFIDNNITEKKRLLAGELKPTARGALEANVSGLEQMSIAYADLLKGFVQEGADPEAGDPPANAPPDVVENWAFMTPEQRALFENIPGGEEQFPK